MELPQPLRQLISATGVKVVPVPIGTWNIDGFAAKLRRSLSVTFSVESVVTSEEVFDAFLDAGVEAEDITSIQFWGSNRSWCVSLRSKASKDHILEKGVIHFGSVAVFIGDADFKTVIVKIYETPLEMPDTVVIGRLSHYGRVLSFHRDIHVVTRVLKRSVVKGTARGTAFRATARAITIGVAAPIADIAAITLPLCIPVTASLRETIAAIVAVRVVKHYFFFFLSFNSRCD